MLSSLSHSEDEISEAASRADSTLLQLLQQSQDAAFEMHTVLHALASHLGSQFTPTLLAALNWVHMLLRKSAARVMGLSQQLWPALFNVLTNASEEVVRLSIEALAIMAPHDNHFEPFCAHLLDLLRRERPLLDRRGAMIVRQLCELLEPHRVFTTLALGLTREEDQDFAAHMVGALNLIVLTSPEAVEMRALLKGAVRHAEGAAFFTTLYRAWSHNPVALLSVCLFAQAYEHASELVLQFAEIEISVPFLMQIDKLVQLIESPVFTHVRLQLLEPEHHPFLLKAMWGILMLLPQSPAFHLLKNRLDATPELGIFRMNIETREPPRPPTGAIPPTIDFGALLRTYREVQAARSARTLRKQQQRRAAAS